MSDDLQEDVERQIKSQGVATYKVSDGHVLVLTRAVLEKLLVAAIESGADRAIIFIQRGARA